MMNLIERGDQALDLSTIFNSIWPLEAELLPWFVLDRLVCAREQMEMAGNPHPE